MIHKLNELLLLLKVFYSEASSRPTRLFHQCIVLVVHNTAITFYNLLDEQYEAEFSQSVKLVTVHIIGAASALKHAIIDRS